MIVNVISLIVLGLVFYSFLPCIRHIRPEQGASHISLAYLLFNLICSTEHVFFGFFNNVNVPLEPELGQWTHHPRNTLDWINFIQLIGVCALFASVFGLGLYNSPASRLRKGLTITIYIGYLMISLVPLIIDSLTDFFCSTQKPNCPEVERDVIFFLVVVHSSLLLPFFTVIPLAIGFYRQARRPTQNLSLFGLKVQAAAFSLAAISWVLRLYFPWHLYRENPHGSWPLHLILPAWYKGVGFVAIDDAAFALGQGILLHLGLRQQKSVMNGDTERQPLLAQRLGDLDSAS